MHPGALHRLITIFDQALQDLGIQAEARELEDLAALIHKAMTVHARQYHTLEHVFSFVDHDRPLQTLTGLFHDIVYYQVDLTFLPEIEALIAPYIRQDDGDQFTIDPGAPEDDLFDLALDTFGFHRGQMISPATGLNEFLSAVVLNLMLGPMLLAEKEQPASRSLAVLLKLDVCIEATIPFRGPTSDGRDGFAALEDRLCALNARWQLGMSAEEICTTLHQAIQVANKDVESFADPDTATFLAKTWRLLPEMNLPLRSRDLYTIREYRQALQQTEAFFSRIDPLRIFHRYGGVPDDETFDQLTAAARRNIEIGRRYLRLKLLAQAILEALAEDTGGDAPLSLFMGDVSPTSSTRRLENFLPPVVDPDWVDAGSDLYRLLESGRADTSDFDLNTSPLSLFIYRCLSPAEIDAGLELAPRMFAGELSPAEFLHAMGPRVVAPVACAGAAMVFTRRRELEKFCS